MTAPLHPNREKGRIGWIVVGSLAVGLASALLLAIAPFISAEATAVRGAVLCGFALGFAALAVLSRRFTDQPQDWATAPAVVMGLSGLLLIGLGPSVDGVLSWVWPPVLLVIAVWMAVRVRRTLHSRTRRWVLYPVVTVLVLAAVGSGWQSVSAAADARAHPMPGLLIDVGDHGLHLNCTGSGSPAVILEAGAGGMSSDFGWIAPAVWKSTRVCAYDRAGDGWSDPVEHAQDAGEIARDLHVLLARADVAGPYVLAGHSFGGLYALTFAARYPDEVAGMVLIDSTAPGASAIPPVPSDDGDSYVLTDHVSALLAASAQLGIVRLLTQRDSDGLPSRAGAEARASSAREKHTRSTIDEYVKASTAVRQAASVTDLGAKPLVVLTAGVASGDAKLAAHDRLAALSTRGVHRVVEGADHMGLIHDQQGAAATSQAILDVVSAARSGA